MKKRILFVAISTSIAVLLLAWVSFKTYIYIKKLTLDRFERQQSLLISQSANGLKSFTDDIIKNLELLATFDSIRVNDDKKVNSDFSAFYARQSPDLVFIFRADTAGVIQVSYPTMPLSFFDSAALNITLNNVLKVRRTSISPVYKTAAGYYAFIILSPVFYGNISGVAGVVISEPRLHKLFIETGISAAGANVLLFNEDGKILSSTFDSKIGESILTLVPPFNKLMSNIPVSNQQEIVIRLKDGKKTYLVSIKTIELLSHNWYLTVVIPEENVLYTTAPWFRRMLVAIFFIVFLLIGIHIITGRLMIYAHRKEIEAHEKIKSAALKERMQRTIETREHFLSNLFQSSSDAIFSLSTPFTFNFINKQTLSLTGYGGEELIGKKFIEIFPADEKERITNIVKKVSDGENIHLKETEILDRDMKRHACLLSLTSMSEENGNISYVGILTDITEIKILRKKLEQSEKMMSLGIMASGLAHEINNPLSSLLGFSKMAVRKSAETPLEGDVLKRYLEKIHESAMLIKGIIEHLNEYTHTPDHPIHPQDLNQIVKHMLSLVSEEMRTANIEIKAELAEVSLVIEGDMSRIAQVILNMLTNARQAQTNGGTITVRTYLDTSEGPFIVLEITDKGEGISQENVEHIFDPFFTTKQPKGTGLGLSICQRIISEYKGSIKVESSPGKGATLIIILPI